LTAEFDFELRRPSADLLRRELTTESTVYTTLF
jgi:hypothetical protein